MAWISFKTQELIIILMNAIVFSLYSHNLTILAMKQKRDKINRIERSIKDALKSMKVESLSCAFCYI